MTFNEAGFPVYSESLSDAARRELGDGRQLNLTAKHQVFLAWHRQRVFRFHHTDEGDVNL